LKYTKAGEMDVLSTFMDLRRRIHSEVATVFGGIGCGIACTVSHGDSQKTLAESLFTSQLSCELCAGEGRSNN
jgi:hypothetical protein